MFKPSLPATWLHTPLACGLALLLCLLTACTQTPTGASAALNPITDLPKVAGVTVRDGVSDWKGQGLVVRALAGENALLRPSSEFQVLGRLGWNDEGLLLQVDVTDTSPSEAKDSARLFEGDSVELFLVSSDKAAGMPQLVASPGGTARQPQPRLRTFDYRSYAFKKDAPPYTPRAVAKRTDHGYVMDMLLPWDALKIKPTPGTVIGARFCVNDAKGRGQGVQKAAWNNYSTGSWWGVLNAVRLSDHASAPCPVAAWAGYDDLKGTYANAIAEPTAAGKTLTALQDGQVVAQAPLTRDGDRAIAKLQWPFPAKGRTGSPVTVQLDGRTVQVFPLPDAVKIRKDMFLSGAGGGGGGGFGRDPNKWLHPAFSSEVFFDENLPTCAYPEPDRINKLVDSYTLDVAYYDDAGRRVTKAAAVGRYAAVATVINAAGDSFTLSQTLYRAATGTPVPTRPAPQVEAESDTQPATQATQPARPQGPEPSPAQWLAARAVNPEVTAFDAFKLDRDWWQNLRTKLNTATRYEYFVRVPKGYDDAKKLWPVIFYLHGSGRGEDANRSRNDGPQGPAKDKADFPFIVVSLRSPGGWLPPAVNDVIDQVAATYRTDPARYYLTGFSMGGMGTWSVAMDRPERFAAIAPVAGRTSDLARMPAIKNVPAWVISGGDDTTVLAADGQKAADALKAAGGEVKLTIIPNAGHTDSDDLAYRWDELYTWFLAHHR